MSNIFSSTFNKVLILLIAFDIILQAIFNDFNFYEHQILLGILTFIGLLLWFSFYLRKINSSIFQHTIFSLFIISSLIFYRYDVKHGFMISNNAIILTILLSYIIASFRHSKSLDILKEENATLRLENTELRQAKIRFHQNIQHNHNVPLGALRNNFEIFSELFFKNFLLRLDKHVPQEDLLKFETLKTSIKLVKDNIEQVISYISHVNEVSKKYQKENICNINYANSINLLDMLQEQLQKLKSKYKNKVILKYDSGICELFNIYADKLQLSEAIYEVLKNQFEYAPTVDKEIIITIRHENLNIQVTMCNGAYMPDEEIQNIFDPGTVNKAVISLAGNRGYGITFARCVIEEHQGHITAQNIVVSDDVMHSGMRNELFVTDDNVHKCIPNASKKNTYFAFTLPMANDYNK